MRSEDWVESVSTSTPRYALGADTSSTGARDLLSEGEGPLARRHKVVDVALPRADAHVSDATTGTHDINRRVGVDDLRRPDERRG